MSGSIGANIRGYVCWMELMKAELASSSAILKSWDLYLKT